MLNPDQALVFIERHGAVLVSAKGPLPCLTEAIVGEPIRGSWWAHTQGKHIFSILRALDDSPDLVTCKLVGGKLTLIHRRLWPALVRCADRIGHEHLAQIREEHTASGKHVTVAVAFPQWVPRAVLLAAKRMRETDAMSELGPVLDAIKAAPGSARAKTRG